MQKNKVVSGKEIPTVPRYKILNRLRSMMKNPIPYFDACTEEYGDTYRLYIGGMFPNILSVNPDFIQHILQKNNKNYAKSPIQTDLLGAYVGMGLLTSNGDYWLRQRRLIQPGFHRQKLAGLVDIMQQVIEEESAHLDQKVADQSTIDMNQEGMELAFKLVAKSLFGSELNANTMEELSEGINMMQKFIIKCVRMPFLKPWMYVSGEISKHKKLAVDCGNILSNLIQSRRKSGKEAADLLDMLLNVRYEDSGEGMTDQQIQDESFIFFVAGHETTANSIAWIFYLLSKHPGTVKRLRAEFDEVLEGGKPTFENLRKLEYTTNVINEALRIYPPAWLTDRIALGDDEVNGYKIKKGEMVIPFIYGAHHSEKLWKDPELFNPDRFKKENKKDRHPYAFLPFGGGPRLCIGMNFAIMEIQMILAHLVRKYDFTLIGDQIIEPNPLITLRPRTGVKMKVSFAK